MKNAMTDGVIEEYRTPSRPQRKEIFPFDRGASPPFSNTVFDEPRRAIKFTARFVDIADLAREAHYASAAAVKMWFGQPTCGPPFAFQDGAPQPGGNRIREMIEEKPCWWTFRATVSARSTA